jgi:4-carboxymuconolactone decarboxylase
VGNESARPPRTYNAFVKRFPKLGDAWDAMRQAEESGPLDEQTMRLVKLGVAVGSQKEGAVHSSVRKAKAAGCSAEAICHVVAVAASTIGLPPAVATYSWVIEELEKTNPPPKA